jgi:glutathione S-transferase
MQLYTAGTGNGQRAAIAVNECGVSCQIHVLNLGQGDQKAADYLKINPTARIPTLIDPEGPDGKPLTVIQSWAILMYLCEKTGKFLPVDPIARVRMFQWMAEGAADLKRLEPRRSSHWTLPWREVDSNPQFRVAEAAGASADLKVRACLAAGEN